MANALIYIYYLFIIYLFLYLNVANVPNGVETLPKISIA